MPELSCQVAAPTAGYLHVGMPLPSGLKAADLMPLRAIDKVGRAYPPPAPPQEALTGY